MEKPKKLGKYEIRRELGRGAMGVVYEAFDPLIERTVAIKTILKSSIDKSEVEEAFNRFRREARAAGRLSHPKIVAIYEYGEDDDMAFIVMELIHGKELKEHFDHEDSFSIDDGIRIVLQILDALDYSHARGVVHRDIKPANILITHSGKIKIADFGIAKVDSSLLTQVGAVMGTPTYMPPEQFMGHEVDRRADLYSTGVILYQFLTGKRPFTGGVISVMHQAVNQEATPPSAINPDVSPQLDEVVKKAMAKRPEDRFQSAAEFMAALKAAAQASAPAKTPTSASDKTIVDLHKAFNSDDTIKLPGRTKPTEASRTNDIESWQSITNSQNPADFNRYLQEFPDGEFAQLARLRLESLEKLSAQARAAAERARLEQEAQVRDALAEKRRRMAEQQAAAEKAQAQAKIQAEAEIRRQREAAEKAQWAQKIAEIKNEADKARAAEAIKREKEAAEQAQRAQELSASLSQRAHKFVEVVSKREAIVDAERKLKMEHKKNLREEVERKKQAKMKVLAKRDAAGIQAPVAVEEKLQRETELAQWDKELAEMKARADNSERLRKEAEERIAQAHKRTRSLILTVGAVLSILLIGVLIALLAAK
ncbi:MAG TPA: protein kinase [Gallionella sp.]|nr:protein kinase [Gallionella sp.]